MHTDEPLLQSYPSHLGAAVCVDKDIMGKKDQPQIQFISQIAHSSHPAAELTALPFLSSTYSMLNFMWLYSFVSVAFNPLSSFFLNTFVTVKYFLFKSKQLGNK